MGSWYGADAGCATIILYGLLSFSQVIEKSSNIGTAKIAGRLSDKQLYTYIRRFGFGEKSLVNLPGEEDGMIRTPKKWTKPTHDSLAFGQEVTVTLCSC